jgi:hypothetical protein
MPLEIALQKRELQEAVKALQRARKAMGGVMRQYSRPDLMDKALLQWSLSPFYYSTSFYKLSTSYYSLAKAETLSVRRH